MRYLSPTFTLPVAQGVSKAEWDRIWKDWEPEQAEPEYAAYYDKKSLEVLHKNFIRPSCLQPLTLDMKFNAIARRITDVTPSTPCDPLTPRATPGSHVPRRPSKPNRRKR